MSDVEGVDLIELLDSAREKRPFIYSAPPNFNLLRGRDSEASDSSRSPRARARPSDDDEGSNSPATKRLSSDSDTTATTITGGKTDKESSKKTTKGVDTSDSWSEAEVECVIDFKAVEDKEDKESHGKHPVTGTKSVDGHKRSLLYVIYEFLIFEIIFHFGKY